MNKVIELRDLVGVTVQLYMPRGYVIGILEVDDDFGLAVHADSGAFYFQDTDVVDFEFVEGCWEISITTDSENCGRLSAQVEDLHEQLEKSREMAGQWMENTVCVEAALREVRADYETVCNHSTSLQDDYNRLNRENIRVHSELAESHLWANEQIDELNSIIGQRGGRIVELVKLGDLANKESAAARADYKHADAAWMKSSKEAAEQEDRYWREVNLRKVSERNELKALKALHEALNRLDEAGLGALELNVPNLGLHEYPDSD